MTAAVSTALGLLVVVAGAAVAVWGARTSRAGSSSAQGHAAASERAAGAAQRARSRAEAAAGGAGTFESLILAEGVPEQRAAALGREFRDRVKAEAAHYRRDQARDRGGVTGSGMARAVDPRAASSAPITSVPRVGRREP